MDTLQERLAKLTPEQREGLLRKLQAQNKVAPAAAPRVTIPPVAHDAPLPLSFAQERLWLIEQILPGQPTYHMPAVVKLAGRIDVAALAQSLNFLVARHASLRTHFMVQDEQPRQLITPALTIPLPVVEATNADEATLIELATQEVLRPFELENPPLLRAMLIRADESEHWLVVTMHHIISDGWSMGRFIEELGISYQALAAGTVPPLQPLPIQYADFAVWQRETWAKDGALERQLTYWRDYLGTQFPPLDLPTDFPRPPALSGAGASYDFSLPLSLSHSLMTLSHAEGATLYMTLLAAFQALLYRYSGQRTFGVGSPIANRNRAELEPLIGFFVNTLVMRADITGDMTFRDLLRQTRTRTLEAYANQELPFEQLVVELNPARDLSRSPLIQTLFVLQNAPIPALHTEGVTLNPVGIGTGRSKFDLRLAITETAQGLDGAFEYSTDLFTYETIVRIAAHFAEMVAGIVADPDTPVARLPLLTAPERDRALVEWNQASPTIEVAARPINEWFDAQAIRFPTAIAVRFEETTYTYAELQARANQLAQFLIQQGVGIEEPVGILLERSAESVVAILGILKSGAAYVPLDTTYPTARIQQIIEEARVRVVLTESALHAQLPAVAGVTAFTRETIAPQLDACPATTPVIPASPDRMMYVLFTSGSTGRPKGVAVTHRTYHNYLREILLRLEVEAGWHYGLVSTFAADLGTTMLYGALCSGGTLHVLSYTRAADPTLFAAYCARYPLDVLKLVPSHFEAFTAADILPRHRLIFAGEACAWSTVAKVRALRPDLVIQNHYGPTETTVAGLTYVVPTPLPTQPGGAHLPLGERLGNIRAYVLNDWLEPLPVGIPGELYIGGAGVTRGYLHNPAMTATRFLPDPFTPIAGARMYRTGDRVMSRANGTIEFLGRVDHQVKVRGYRIELGDIEDALRHHPAVQNGAVVVRDAGTSNAYLVAYVALHTGYTLESSGLRTHLAERLPAYMIPTVRLLPALPLTPNGKIDRQALPTHDDHGDGSDTYLAPRTPIEHQLAELLGGLLKVERVGIHDNFFALGGHSLLATQFMARLNQHFHIELPLRVLFESPTVAELGERVLTSPVSGALAPIPLVDRTQPLPLSFAQERLWLLEQLTPGTATYHIPAALWLEGELETDALTQSVSVVIQRHESLRTHFEVSGDIPYQVIDPATSLVIAVEDARAWEKATLLEQVNHAVMQPFDLETGPLFRVRLYQRSATLHLFVVTMHHIISDGWSTGRFIEEIAASYAALRRAEPNRLPPLPLQYADFAAWQRHWLVQEGAEQIQLAYWRSQLGNDLPPLELPTDMPRPAMLSGAGATHSFRLGKQIADGLQALSHQEGATLYMTLLAAFQVLLHRYSGQSIFGVGSPIANRTRADLEPLIGFFVNTLVMKADLSAEPSFRTLLREVRERTLGAYTHQDIPFERLVAELQPARELNRTPLFQVMFVLQNTPGTALMVEGLTIQPLEVNTHRAKFDLLLSLGESDDGLMGAFEYSTELFSAATIQRMVTHFETLLQSILATPDGKVTHLKLLPVSEQETLVRTWNATYRPYADHETLHNLFTRQAQATPDTIALVYGDATFTYAQLEQRANQLAHHLQRLGVGVHSFVGLCVERSLDMVTAILAILKTGGTYVPLDPAYPGERLHTILADSQAVVLITQSHLQTRLPDHHLPIFDLDQDWATIADLPTTPPLHHASAETLVYVMYTSGSTGKPKGVAVTHRNVARLVLNSEFMGMAADETFFQFSSISFDVSTLELWASLINGGRLVIAPAGLPTLQEIGDVVRRQGVTALWLTAGLFHLMVEEQLDALLGVRQVVAGGDILSVSHVRRLLEARNGGVVINGYGPTENTTFTTCYSMTDPAQIGSTVPIGYPITNTTTYIVDRHLQLVPIGVYGELVTGGDGVAQGYFNRPTLTAEKFIPDPFSAEAGARLYRTGDVARWKADGTLEFLGRFDHQVKLRGFRIELGEIESVIRQHPAVLNTIVVAQGTSAQNKVLVAYVVPQAEISLTRTELHEYLAERLPDYMVPTFIMVIAELPLNPNGKVDRRALPAVSATHADQGAYEAPATDTEQTIAELMATLLGVDTLGRRDNFFVCGGHSLLATQLMTRVNRHFGVRLPLRTLFEGATIAELATAVHHSTQQQVPATTIPLAPRDEPLPLSFAQERLWVLEQIAPHQPTYHIPAVWRLTGTLDIDAFTAAMTQVVTRHESLRTAFVTINGEPRQMIAPAPATFPVPLIDGTGWDEATLIAQVQAEILRPFDLTTAPLFRLALVQQGNQEYLLVLTLHHIIADGWSMGVLMRELSEGYRAALQGISATLPSLPIQYPDFALWQREWLEREGILAHQLEYWRGRLGHHLPVLNLPTDHPRPPIPSGQGAVIPFEIPSAIARSLTTLGQSEGATRYMTLLAAFYTFLYRFSGQSTLVVGSPIANRTRTELEPLIGFFVNTLALRADVQGTMTFRELLAQVRTRTLEAYAHQDIPFERLVTELEPTRDVSRSPLFQVMFTLQNAGSPLPPLGDLDLTALDIAKGIAKFDLTLALSEHETGIAGVFEYSTDLFSAETIARFRTHFLELLGNLVAHPEMAVAQVDLLPVADQQQLLEAWVPPLPVPPTELITDIIAAHAHRHPTAPALANEDIQLTYGELEARATHLAHRLRAQGVGTETIVGVCMERGPLAVVALLAILKAGGAYVPLDTAYPAERLRMMVTDSHIALLLTTFTVAEALPELPVPLWMVEEKILAEPEPLLALPVPHRDALAYMIYTSGSTGMPKGVMVSHASLLELVRWTTTTFGITAADHTMQSASLAFDASVWEIWSYLAAGSAVFFPNEETRLSPDLLQSYLIHHEIAVTFLPTPLAEQLLTLPWDKACRLRYLLTGGDRLRQLPPENLPFILVNNYGPTENTVVSTSGNVSSKGVALPTIGRTLPYVQSYILDPYLNPVPVGVAGELYIGGSGVARGYWHRPALTADRFIPHPYSEVPGARLYRTGDVVRYTPHGEIEFLGRADEQIKVRGFRIELGEIEAQLESQTGIQSAAVLAWGDGDTKQLVAYLVPAIEAPTDEWIRATLKASLPAYMIPSRFVRVPAIPLTPNGKVDRRVLPAPDTHSSPTTTAVAPRDTLEGQLVILWEQLLKTHPIGITDNFFELGGNSLLAVRLAGKIQTTLGQTLPISVLFQSPTIESLAIWLRQHHGETHTHTEPLVMIQQGLPTHPTLYVVHPAGGNVMAYLPLVRALGSDIPVIGIQAQESLPADTFEALASHYATAIRARQPDGPYYLLGWSLGGVLAYAIAHQLQSNGATIPVVILVDSHLPTQEVPSVAHLLLNFARDMGIAPATIAQWVEANAVSEPPTLETLWHTFKTEGVLSPDISMSQLQGMYDRFATLVTALHQYVPPVYAGNVMVFQATIQPTDVREGLGWNRTVSALTVVPVSGDHYTLLQSPQVTTIVDHVRPHIMLTPGDIP